MAPMLDDDLIGTLSDSDVISDEDHAAEELPVEQNSKKRKLESKKQRAVKKQKKEDVQAVDRAEDEDVDSEFEFGLENGATLLDDGETFLGGTGFSSKATFDVDAAATRRRQDLDPQHDESDEQRDSQSEASFDGFGGGADMAEDEEEDEEVESDEEQALAGSDEELEIDDAQHKQAKDDASDSAPEEQSDALELERRNAFFASDAPATNDSSKQTFHSMSLSRPILKGLAEIGFAAPTPVQLKAIPVALAGKDIVGGAVTGSGKTAAFIIPILERLLYRPKKSATTRVVILTPTRELAIQCLNVAKKLASFTDITFGSAIGGMNIREQERDLKRRPDIVIATPGRFIDLERNYSCFAVNTIEILVLDEADRMLEEGFADELNEILAKIPKSRQTMLFSATMTSKVDDLIRVGLRHPVSIMVNPHHQTVTGLEQEFVRLRAGREEKRLAYLMCLCSKIHTDRVIIFFRQKKDAHRVRVLFALCNLKAAELHGNMTQEQRIQAIESFRSGKVSFLLATDLASRGLDIKGIETVINYEAPQSLEIYLHRVGRTARAGKSGRSCTLTAEPDRKVIKAVVKVAKAQGAKTKQRIIDAKEADDWHRRVQDLQSEVEAILKEEKEERAMQNTERDLTRADNIVTHKEEIMSRPKKTWFESEAEKKKAKLKGGEVLNGPAVEQPVKKKIPGKLSNKQKKRLRDKDERRDAGMWKKGKGSRSVK